MERQFVDHDLTAEQRQQSDIGHETMNVCDRVAYLWQGIVLFNRLEVIQLQIEWECQTDVAYCDLHACLL